MYMGVDSWWSGCLENFQEKVLKFQIVSAVNDQWKVVSWNKSQGFVCLFGKFGDDLEETCTF